MTREDLLLVIEAVRAVDSDKAEVQRMLREMLERLVRIEARLAKPTFRKPAPAGGKMYVDEVMKKTGLSRGTIYSLIKRGEFPAGTRSPGRKRTTWESDEIEAWMEQAS